MDVHQKVLRRSMIVTFLILGCLLLSKGCATPVKADPERLPLPEYLSGEEVVAARVYQKAIPAVVTIYTSRKRSPATDEMVPGGLGSGVLISASGLVLTAAHVVYGSDEINLKTYDGKEFSAGLLFSENSADIALIRIVDPPPGLQHAELGDSDRLVVGQMAYAIGSPYGLENSFSAGHISGFRDFDRYYDGTIRARFLQTDAAINLGNSGGPVLNSKGQVIGIASQILTLTGGFQGIGFVVPVNIAKQLLSLKDRVWLGIEGIYLNREGVSKILNQDLNGGLLIERVAKGSPADKAGLQGGAVAAQMLGRNFMLGGDLILEFGTREACSSDCLADAPRHFAGMDEIPVTYLRAGKIHQTTIDLSGNRINFLEE